MFLDESHREISNTLPCSFCWKYCLLYLIIAIEVSAQVHLPGKINILALQGNFRLFDDNYEMAINSSGKTSDFQWMLNATFLTTEHLSFQEEKNGAADEKQICGKDYLIFCYLFLSTVITLFGFIGKLKIVFANSRFLQ